MRQNRRGVIGTWEIVITVVLIFGVSLFAWWSSSEEAVGPETTQVALEDTATETLTTISFKEASFDFVLPDDWTLTQAEGLAGDEYFVTMVEPSGVIDFYFRISKKENPEGERISDGSFLGVSGNKFFWHANLQNSEEVVSPYYASACDTVHCYPGLGAGYRLSIYMNKHDERSTVPIDLESQLVNQFEEAINSIVLDT